MKTKILLILALIILSISGTAITMHLVEAEKSQPTKVIKFSEKPEDEVRVGDIALDKIKKQINISSYEHQISYPFDTGKLDKDATFKEKFKYTFVGKSMTIDMHTDYHYNSDLLKVNAEDIIFNKETKKLTVYLEKPSLKASMNTKKTDPDSFNGLFVGGYTEKERMHILDQAVEAGKVLIKDDPDRLKQAEEEIEDGLTEFLSLIDTVKDVDVKFKK